MNFSIARAGSPIVSRKAIPRPPNRRLRRHGAFASFTYRHFQRYSIATFLSNTSLAAAMLVRTWLIQDLSHSPFLVALVPALIMAPMLVL
ncbi:MAG: hypothetical protein HY682_08765, partial [Chloroflexi bacterium]|nr:hypothetical protein [Chloroflexota bacterium]